ncbi:MotE family protein [Thioclava sp. FR2]|uniref:MotE family protein n=1 Tax=Thioclava sp. FR2 TaxID=3445780 RepID=UPI003EB769EE
MSKLGLPRSIGPLTLIALLFALSAALRINHGIGAAMALQASPSKEESPGPLHCPEPPERLAEALKRRDAEVTTREASLKDRIAALQLSEAVIARRLDELREAEASLRATLAIADGAAENDLLRLTAVYEAMKPVDAAKLFGTMAPEFAAGFLGRMRPDAAAAIMSGMEPDKAYSISVLVAGRNALAPKE